MLAFAIEYDRQFKAHFFDRYCCGSPPAGFDVLIEPDSWGDLILKNDVKHRVFICELKIAASLENKQNPSKEEFWQDGGYGYSIKSRFAGSKVTYTTIENDPSWGRALPNNIGLECQPSAWKRLARERSKKTLESNLYETLGNLGVHCFNPIIANNMKFGNIARKAVQLPNCLNDVIVELRRCDVKCDRPNPSLWIEQGSWSYGSGIPSKPHSNLGRITRATKKGGEQGWMAWFGYEGDPSRLAVYFYCGNGGTQAVAARLRTAFPKIAPVVNRTENWVGFYCKPNDSNGDFKWFTSVVGCSHENALVASESRMLGESGPDARINSRAA